MVYAHLIGKRYEIYAQTTSAHPCGFQLWRTRLDGAQRMTFYGCGLLRRSGATHSAPDSDTPNACGTASNFNEATESQFVDRRFNRGA